MQNGLFGYGCKLVKYARKSTHVWKSIQAKWNYLSVFKGLTEQAENIPVIECKKVISAS